MSTTASPPLSMNHRQGLLVFQLQFSPQTLDGSAGCSPPSPSGRCLHRPLERVRGKVSMSSVQSQRSAMLRLQHPTLTSSTCMPGCAGRRHSPPGTGYTTNTKSGSSQTSLSLPFTEKGPGAMGLSDTQGHPAGPDLSPICMPPSRAQALRHQGTWSHHQLKE